MIDRYTTGSEQNTADPSRRLGMSSEEAVWVGHYLRIAELALDERMPPSRASLIHAYGWNAREDEKFEWLRLRRIA